MNNPLYYQYMKTAYGALILAEFDGQIVLCDWQYRKMRHAVDTRIKKATSSLWVEESTPLLRQLKDEITAYLAGGRQKFSVPYRLVGTEFQQSVWRALVNVPYGAQVTYAMLAQQAGAPNAVRAVGAANGANALSLIVPCHRIVGHDGALVGYAGGVGVKRKLLSLEGPKPLFKG